MDTEILRLLISPLLHQIGQLYSLMIQETCLGYLPFSFSRNRCRKSDNFTSKLFRNVPNFFNQPGATRPQRLSELNSAETSVDPPHHTTIADQDREHTAALTCQHQTDMK